MGIPLGVLKRMDELIVLIKKHDLLYHQKDEPIISDNEYDGLRQELLAIEEEYPDFISPDSPRYRVGAPADDRFEKIKHARPMLSLSNAFSIDDVVTFDARICHNLRSVPLYTDTKALYCLEMKYDGVSIDLEYVAHRGGLSFDRAISRGDGYEGEDLTHSVMSVPGVVMDILENEFSPGEAKKILIRGEIIMDKKRFEEMNKELEAAGKKTYSNPRNAAAGLIRRHEELDAEALGLKFIPYSMLEATGDHSEVIPRTQMATLELLDRLGFEVPMEYVMVSFIDDIASYYDHIQSVREHLPFCIDGIVIKVNDRNQQALIGYNSNSPRYATAFKYPAEESETRIVDIITQVGRTGVLTPVACLEPIFVGGVVVSRATLHNVSEILRKDIRIGDYVVVRRAGDVIPEIVRPIPEMRTSDIVEFEMPLECPACASEVQLMVSDSDIITHYCPNTGSCPEQRLSSLEHFVSRKAFNIMGLGPAILSLLAEEQLIDSFSDIFDLTLDDLCEVAGEKVSENILRSIEKSRTVTLQRFLYALGIPNVGEGTSKVLSTMRSLEAIRRADKETLLALEDMGPIKVGSIMLYFANNWESIDKLAKRVDIVQSNEPEEAQTLAGKVFCISGSFEGRTRDEIRKHIEARGGKLMKDVSNRADFMLVGDNASRSKVAKAVELKLELLYFVPSVVEVF